MDLDQSGERENGKRAPEEMGNLSIYLPLMTALLVVSYLPRKDLGELLSFCCTGFVVMSASELASHLKHS